VHEDSRTWPADFARAKDRKMSIERGIIQREVRADGAGRDDIQEQVPTMPARHNRIRGRFCLAQWSLWNSSRLVVWTGKS